MKTTALPGVWEDTMGFLHVLIDHEEYSGLAKRPYPNGVVLARESAWRDRYAGRTTEVYALYWADNEWSVVGRWYGVHAGSQNEPRAASYSEWVRAMKAWVPNSPGV